MHGDSWLNFLAAKRKDMDLSKLANIPIFKDLNEQQSQVLAGVMREKVVAPGTAVFSQGQRAFSCFFIIDGTVHVHVQNEDTKQSKQVASLGKGEMGGELALVDGGLRSASCKAGSEQVTLAELQRDDFEHILNAGNSFAFRLLDTISIGLVSRLRDTSKKLMHIVNADNNA